MKICEMLSLKLSKYASLNTTQKNEKQRLRFAQLNDKDVFLSLLIYRGREQDGQGRESRDKDMGSGWF